MSTEKKEDTGKNDVGYFFNFKEVLLYYFRKKDPNRKPDLNLKMMHGINKIAIVMFLVALVVIVVRLISRA
ncbi:MAG: hypothetical protein KI791_17470 [Cyclobacteriaceae bacterium]|nr:hypothetical protein [Cyclobacteriaceae bacterium SS2]